MNFSLKKYIKENRLNESLNSDILINEIINDTGGFFRYYKAPYNNSMYERILELVKKMKDILGSLFGTTYQYNQPKIDKVPIDTDEKMRYVHKKYMEYYNKYMNMVPLVFNKVEPRILISLISFDITYDTGINAKSLSNQTTVDMFNITDDNFKTYYLNEFKGNKEFKSKVLQEVNTSFVFWIDYKGKILAVSKMGRILLFAPDNNNSEILNKSSYKSGNTGSIENMHNKVSRDMLEKNEYTYIYKLSNGEKLVFPSPVLNSYSSDFDFSIETVGINFLRYLDITVYNFKYKDIISVGKFYVSSSQIQKYTDWGKNEDDKLIIYKTSDPFDDGRNKSKWTQRIKNSNKNEGEPEYTYELRDMPSTERYQYGYNEYKQRKDYNPAQDDKKSGYRFASRMKYKWEKDIFDRYKPYAGGKQNELFGYERSLTDGERLKLYYRDDYCTEIANNNFKNYRYQSLKLKTVKAVSNEIKTRLKDLLSTVWEHVLRGKEWGKTLKEYKGTPLFIEIMTAFDVYMKSTGYCIAQLATAEKLIKEFLAVYNFKNKNGKEKEVSNYDKEYISDKYKKIITLLDNVLNFTNQLYDLENKINELAED